MKEHTIKELLENSTKAEICEDLAKTLEIEGSKVIIIKGIPNDDDGIDIRVRQYGFRYDYELMGFVNIGYDIISGNCEEEE